MDSMETREGQYTTSRGYVLEFLPIPTLIAKLNQQYPAPQPPTYTVAVAGGTETHAHDATTLETPEDLAAWESYQRAVREHTAKVVQAQLRLCLMRGVKVLNADPASESWAEEQRLIGFDVPVNPIDRKLHWMETEVLNESGDLIAILSGVSRASGISEEVVSAMEASFWRAMGRAERNASARALAATQPEAMVGGNAVRTNGRGGAEPHSSVVALGEDERRR